MEQRERQEAAQEPQTHTLRHTYNPQHIYTHLPLTGPDTPSPWQSVHTPLSTLKRQGTLAHSTAQSTPHAQAPPAGPEWLPGLARRAGHGHWEPTGESLLRSPLRLYLPHQNRHWEGRSLCVLPPQGQKDSHLSPHALAT